MDKKRHGAEDHICEGCWNDASEPDVLERLRWWDGYFNDAKPDKFKNPHPLFKDNPTGFDESAIERDVADAIAEIKNTRNLLKLSLDALKLHQLEFEIRREGTEAEPVMYQYRNIDLGGPWTECFQGLYHRRKTDPACEVRALAVVAPEGDTEE